MKPSSCEKNSNTIAKTEQLRAVQDSQEPAEILLHEDSLHRSGRLLVNRLTCRYNAIRFPRSGSDMALRIIFDACKII